MTRAICSRLPLIGAVLALVTLTSCTSVHDAGEPPTTRPEKAPKPIEVTEFQQAAPSRDAVAQDDNNLALIDELRTRLALVQAEFQAKAQELEKTRTVAATAREGEMQVVADRERLEKLLQGALAREKDLEALLIKTRIELVQARQEIYRQKIRGLGNRGDE